MICGKRKISSKGNIKDKGPEMGMNLVILRDSKKCQNDYRAVTDSENRRK